VAGLTRERRLDVAVGAGVLLAYGILQLWLLQGPRPWDVSVYFDAAVNPGGAERNLFTMRFGLIAPVRAAVLLFGPSEAAFYAAPVAFGLLLTGAVYATALALFADRWLAACAALVTGLAPSYLLNSSFIFPDNGGAATFTAGFFCLVLGARNAEPEGRPWAPAAWAAAAGLFFGWTVLIREFSLILTPTLIASLFLLRYPWRRATLLGGVTVATVLLDPLYGLVQYGRPFVHLKALLVNRPNRPVTGDDEALVEHFHEQLQTVFDTAAVLPRLLLTWHVGWLWLFLMLVFAVALVVLRDRRLVILAVWFLNVWVFMTLAGLGSLPSGRWILNITNVRYWYPAFPPLVMGALAGGYLFARRFSPSRYAVVLPAIAVAALAVVVAAPGVAEYRTCQAKDVWASEPPERWDEVRDWLARSEGRAYPVLYTDRDTERLAPFLTRGTFGGTSWPGDVRAFRRPHRAIVRPPSRSDGLVLINKDRFRAPAELERLRSDWLPVFASDDGAMVLLAHRSRAGASASTDESWWQVPDDLAKRRAAQGCGANPYRPPADELAGPAR
jgi:hypothetical protein